MPQETDQMTSLRKFTLDFNRETGAIITREGDRPINLVTLDCVPSIDSRHGQRDPSYLEDKIFLPSDKKIVQITTAFRRMLPPTKY